MTKLRADALSAGSCVTARSKTKSSAEGDRVMGIVCAVIPPTRRSPVKAAIAQKELEENSCVARTRR